MFLSAGSGAAGMASLPSVVLITKIMCCILAACDRWGVARFEGRNRTSCFLENNGSDLHRRHWRLLGGSGLQRSAKTKDRETDVADVYPDG